MKNKSIYVYEIPNWKKYQNYHKGKNWSEQQPWFKFYSRELINDPVWLRLDPYVRDFLIQCWCIASQKQGLLPDLNEIAFRLHRENDLHQYREKLSSLEGKSLEECMESLIENDYVNKLENNLTELEAGELIEEVVSIEEKINVTHIPDSFEKEEKFFDFGKPVYVKPSQVRTKRDLVLFLNSLKSDYAMDQVLNWAIKNRYTEVKDKSELQKRSRNIQG